MFSSLGSTISNNRYFNGWGSTKQGQGNALENEAYRSKVPQAFATVPAVSSELDVNYRSLPSSDSSRARVAGYTAEELAKVSNMTHGAANRLSTYANTPQNAQTYQRPQLALNASYHIRPCGVSRDNYVYERSISSKSDIHSESEPSPVDEPDSPSSIHTDLSAAISIETSATFQSVAVTLGPSSASSSTASPPTPVRKPLPLPTQVSEPTYAIRTPSAVESSTQSLLRPVASRGGNSAKRRSMILTSDYSTAGTSPEEVTGQGPPFRGRLANRNNEQKQTPPNYLAAAQTVVGGGFAGSGAPSAPVSEMVPKRSRQLSHYNAAPLQSTRSQVGADAEAVPFRAVRPPGLDRLADSPQHGVERPAYNSPHRRNSDGDQNVGKPMVSSTPAAIGNLRSASVPRGPRGVHWNENLVCPSPLPVSEKRKGWYNRRGDQLWTNEGAYKPPAAIEEYPPDLDDYPEYGEGWQNEDGLRIDMRHRHIPKQPLRSALKQSRLQRQIY